MLTTINQLGTRLKQFRVCGAAVELYHLKPEPRDMGSYVMTFRERTVIIENVLAKAYRLLDEDRRLKARKKTASLPA